VQRPFVLCFGRRVRQENHFLEFRINTDMMLKMYRSTCLFPPRDSDCLEHRVVMQRMSDNDISTPLNVSSRQGLDQSFLALA
jgi:hypothetical protein